MKSQIACIACLAACAAGLVLPTTFAGPVLRGVDDAGVRVLPPTGGDDWGRPLARGDLDGDGYDDFIVADSASYGGFTSRVYIVRGGAGAHGIGDLNLASTAADQTVLGAAVDDNLGCSMATGDVNGDEIDDLLLVASSADEPGLENSGKAYLIFGGASFFDMPVRDLAVTANWDLRILGPVAGGDMGGANAFGGLDTHAAAIGNLNGDQYGDMVLGVHLADGGGSQAGRVYVINGGPFPSGFTIGLQSYYTVRVDGKYTYDELGTYVLTGDITGDGIDELIIPNFYSSVGLFTDEGRVFILRGRTSWPSHITLQNTAADITLIGDREQDELGSAAVVGDFNNDGITDLATAAPGADAGAWDDQIGDGFVYGLLGSTDYQTGTHVIAYENVEPDFLIIGEFQKTLGDELSAGDFNADGYMDIAAAERFGGPQTNGVVEVVFGRDFAPGETFTANVNTDLRLIGNAQDRAGFSLSACDVNSDGMDEVFFGSPFANGYAGAVWLYSYVTGDADHDGDVDLADLAQLQNCAGVAPLSGACLFVDMDLSESVDADDLDGIAAAMTGPDA